MSLKAFHVFFIIASILLTLGFGLWAVDDYSQSGSPLHLAFAVSSCIVTALLSWYGVWFLRKLKNESYL